jgi:hypothetical protein
MPPYGRLAGIVILSSTELEPAFALGQALAQADAPLRAIGAQVFGPAPAPIARIRGRHRVRLLVKAPKGAPLQSALGAWLRPHKLPAIAAGRGYRPAKLFLIRLHRAQSGLSLAQKSEGETACSDLALIKPA